MYACFVGDGEVASADLVRTLCRQAAELNRLLGVLIDRKGSVTSVILGDGSRLYLPDIGRSRASSSRLRGVRLVVVKPRRSTQATYPLDRDFRMDLEKLQLDLVLQIEGLPDGTAGRCVLGTLSPSIHCQIESYSSFKAIDFHFSELIAELEASLLKSSPKVAYGAREKAVLVGVYATPREQWQASMNELQELAKTAQVQILDTVIQQRRVLDPRTIVGSGKLEELCLNALHLGAEMLIFDRDLTPSQLNAITEATDLKILDRTMLILDIFAQRAKSRSGKLQVELAQLQYSLPRLAKKHSGLSRLTGGIGGVGPGETKLELDRRRVKDRVAKLEREIDKLCEQRERTRQGRQNKHFPVVSLVGYTNAGKSTLMNRLTQSDIDAENALFVTLDTTSRKRWLPNGREIILIDTVGFIRDLPQGLINAFRATLEELQEADLLLHVVDGSDPEAPQHVRVVNDLIDTLGLSDKPKLLVVNKADRFEADFTQKAWMKQQEGILVSAQTGFGLSDLLENLLSL